MNFITKLFHKHTPSKTRKVTTGHGYGSEIHDVPVKGAICTDPKCDKVF